MQGWHEGGWQLPTKYWCYKNMFDLLWKTKTLFNKLFVSYKICLKCIFRIYSIELPKLYSDAPFYLEIIPHLISANQTTTTVLSQYNTMQCSLNQICWLCEEILQKSYVNKVIAQINQQIKDKGYDNSTKFKLNIRVPHILTLKNVFFIRYVYEEMKKQITIKRKSRQVKEEPIIASEEGDNKQSQFKGKQEQEKEQDQIRMLYNVLIAPLQSNKSIDNKLVLKWILSNQINNQTNMTSTSEDNHQNLTISIDQNYNCQEIQSAIMRKFAFLLALQKKNKQRSKHQKKHVAENIQENAEEQLEMFKCTSINVNKILALRHHEFTTIFDKIPTKSEILQIMLGVDAAKQLGDDFNRLKFYSHVSHQINLQTRNLFLCGKYIKFSRYLSQTPWVVNGKKLTEGSLQEEIQDKIYHLFYPGKSKEEVEVKFHSGGREDIDVRMLKGGRPFVLQFCNPIRAINKIEEEEILCLINKNQHEEMYQQVDSYIAENYKSQLPKHVLKDKRVVKMLEYVINNNNMYVQVCDFMETNQSFISVELKAAETQKIKHYICYIYSMEKLTEEDVEIVSKLQNIKIKQQTPLRVMHRRALLVREKEVYKLAMHLVSEHSAVLQVWASAGTYIKEFVHGDLARTVPNVGLLLKKQVDILQLDVGSLKEGQWKQGDDFKMKMDHFQWMD